VKPRVAMIAYACDPEGSGEHWLGWGWAEQAAQRFDVQLLTPPKSREAIERHAARAGITPHFVELPSAVRALSEKLGGLGSWWRKIAWQKLAARRVAELHARGKIALVHQTTFHTFRVPFSAALLGIPSVWGPIAGGERTPPGFERFLGAARGSERRRVLSNRLCLAAPGVQRSFRAASTIFVSNHTTLDFLPGFARPKCQVILPNTLRPGDEPAVCERPMLADRLSLLYVGNCVATRSVPLVLHALARLRDLAFTLTIVGQGPALEDWRREASSLGLVQQTHFAGQVPRGQLDSSYAAADALVFPALRDAGGSALLEAMSRGLPVVCFDWGGPAEMVDHESGVKIAVRNPEQTIADLAAAFSRLRAEPHWRAALAARAVERVRMQFTWEAKRRLLETTYARLIEGR
jgi:glycosyltransferase involved in cell wall biosynthesis